MSMDKDNIRTLFLVDLCLVCGLAGVLLSVALGMLLPLLQIQVSVEQLQSFEPVALQLLLVPLLAFLAWLAYGVLRLSAPRQESSAMMGVLTTFGGAAAFLCGAFYGLVLPMRQPWLTPIGFSVAEAVAAVVLIVVFWLGYRWLRPHDGATKAMLPDMRP